MLVLSKISDPGWTREFETYTDVYEILKGYCCRECTSEALVNELLGTACGAEFMLEEDAEIE